MKQRKAKLISGPVGKGLISLTLPMIVGIFSIVAFNLADTYFVAQLGTKELAAMGFIFPLVMLIGAMALGLGMGASSVISRTIGKGDQEKVRRFATDGLFLALVIIFIFVVTGLLTIKPLFTLLGAPPDILLLIRQYMTIWYIGMLFVVVPMVGNHAIRATGDTKFPSLIMMISAGINVILDPIMIFGLFGFPRLELAGAALSTVIARTTSMILSLSILHFRERMIDFSIPRLHTLLESWKKILYVGIPAAGTNIMIPVSLGVITRLVAGFGPEAVAAVGAGGRVQTFALMVTMALAATMIPYIGQNWGAGRYERVRLAQKYSYSFSLAWGILCFVVMAVLAKSIARLFSKEPLVIKGITWYLWIISIGYGFQGICRLTASVFNAINKPLISAGLNFFRLFVLYIPLSYVGGRYIGLKGVYWGVTVSNVAAGIISLLWIRRTCEREKKTGFM